MNVPENVEEAVELLQQFGLRGCEARCFVGLLQLSPGTAKQVSEITEVPRTRVYDSIRVLEARGLVEIQHTSPRQFRAVPLDEAVEALRCQYENRAERLHDALQSVEGLDVETSQPGLQIWTMSGREATQNRTTDLLANSHEEVVLVLGHEVLLTDELVDSLNAVDDAVELYVGAVPSSLQERIETAVPNATTFVPVLDWLHGGTDQEGGTSDLEDGRSDQEDGAADHGAEVAIGRLLLVDRSTALVSSVVHETMEEQAIYGAGFGNALVLVTRQLMTRGYLPARSTRMCSETGGRYPTYPPNHS